MRDKYKITDIKFNNNKIQLKIGNINLKNYSDIDVGLKNIKTKEIIPISSFLGEETILISLDSVRSLCTDNEYNIVINFESGKLSNALSTVVSSSLIKNLQLNKLDLSSIGWFLRINEKNIPLLSAIHD